MKTAFKVGDRVVVNVPEIFNKECAGTVAALRPEAPNWIRVLADGTAFAFTVSNDYCRPA
jgi:hypothetical protein